MTLLRRTALVRSGEPFHAKQALKRLTPLSRARTPLKRSALSRSSKPLKRSPLARNTKPLQRLTPLARVPLNRKIVAIPARSSPDSLDRNTAPALPCPKKKYRKKNRREILDPRSPDGKRVILEGADWTRERRRTAMAGKHKCEGCEESHPLPFGKFGHAHHRFGRGGGKRDDRLWRPMAANSPNLLERWWVRQLLWTCMLGHKRLHAKGLLKFRPSQMSWCAIHGCVIYAA